MQTIRFFNDYEKYMGWKYLKNTSIREVRSWLNSGNFVMIGKKLYTLTNIEELTLKHLDELLS